MVADRKQLKCSEYTVAWICALRAELLAARLMLNEEHNPPAYNTNYDENTYVFGSIEGHEVVLASLPKGETGNTNAGRLTGAMFHTFPNIKIALLVGIGGGVPRPHLSPEPLQNIHLGDVVVGWPGDGKPAVVNWDRGRMKTDGVFEMVGTMDKPAWRVRQALDIVASNHDMEKTKFKDHLRRLKGRPQFAHPGLENDRLFKAHYNHVGDRNDNCVSCDATELVDQTPRAEEHKDIFVYHSGRIATGNAVIQSGVDRDKTSKQCDGVLCFEMEAAGVAINGPVLVIRGISDYADSHKNDVWKLYAAGNAAVFARELLCTIAPNSTSNMESIEAPKGE
jgi:nucleoside phosphorylase